MRIGMSVNKKELSSVLVNKNGMIVNAVQTTYEKTLTFSEAVKTNIETLVMPSQQNNVMHTFIGTDFVKSFLEEDAHLLTGVGVIRLAGQQPNELYPCFCWPEHIRTSVLKGCETVNGGFKYTGIPITKMQKAEIIAATQRLIQQGAQCIVICGVFSTFYNAQEIAAKNIISDNFDVDTLCCYELETIGFMERENAGILNAALRKLFSEKLHIISETFSELGMKCRLCFTQKNGTSLSLEEAMRFPLKTRDSVLVNSFVGASKLTQFQDALVIDMGETGAAARTIMGGMPTCPSSDDTMDMNFDSSSVDFMDLGLNSPISIEGGDIIIGSAAYAKSAALSEKQLTLKTAMLICNNQHVEDCDLSTFSAYRVIEEVDRRLVDFYQKIHNRSLDMPIVLVGKASALFPHHKSIVCPSFSQFSSAYGAAACEVSYTLRKTVCLVEREKMLAELCASVMQIIRDRGGQAPKISNLHVQCFRYLPNQQWAQVTISATGEIDHGTNFSAYEMAALQNESVAHGSA